MDTRRRRLLQFATLLPVLPWLVPAGAAGRPRVAVTAFENRVRGAFSTWSLGDGLAEMLTTELVRDGRFTVVERAALTDVLREQELGQTGLVAGGAPRTGRLLAAEYVIRGAVTEFGDTSGGGGGLQYKGFGIAGKSNKATIALDVRVVDAATGSVVESRRVAREVSSAGGKVNYSNADFRIGGGGFSRTPLGKVTREALAEAVGFIASAVGGRGGGRSGDLKVIKSSGGRIYLNGGRNRGVNVGDRFRVMGSGEALVDPDTGLELGRVDSESGVIEVIQVQDRFAVARPVSGGGFARGDRLEPY